jgi:hypothetical protein
MANGSRPEISSEEINQCHVPDISKKLRHAPPGSPSPNPTPQHLNDILQKEIDSSPLDTPQKLVWKFSIELDKFLTLTHYPVKHQVGMTVREPQVAAYFKFLEANVFDFSYKRIREKHVILFFTLIGIAAGTTLLCTVLAFAALGGGDRWACFIIGLVFGILLILVALLTWALGIPNKLRNRGQQIKEKSAEYQWEYLDVMARENLVIRGGGYGGWISFEVDGIAEGLVAEFPSSLEPEIKENRGPVQKCESRMFEVLMKQETQAPENGRQGLGGLLSKKSNHGYDKPEEWTIESKNQDDSMVQSLKHGQEEEDANANIEEIGIEIEISDGYSQEVGS